MEIIPVMDLLNGQVVHAVKGERDKYRPIRSILCSSADPIDVAKTFRQLDLNKLYLADLDAIQAKGNNFQIYKKIVENTNLKIMVDAGINKIEIAEKVIENGATQIIIGTETLGSLNFIKTCLTKYGEDKVIISIDVKNGKLLHKTTELDSKSPLETALTLEELGVKTIIVLDLGRVGSMQGINFDVLLPILKKTDLEIITGGGIRNFNDIIELQKYPIKGVLVATALHNGNITKEDLKKLTHQ
jgi:phosphoribosylformimino-5-aminoimidazole carboxamide ribotide isomerase